MEKIPLGGGDAWRPAPRSEVVLDGEEFEHLKRCNPDLVSKHCPKGKCEFELGDLCKKLESGEIKISIREPKRD